MVSVRFLPDLARFLTDLPCDSLHALQGPRQHLVFTVVILIALYSPVTLPMGGAVGPMGFPSWPHEPPS